MKNNYGNNFKSFRLVFLGFIFLMILSCQPNQSVEVENLTVEYLSNPLGVDVEHPRFSWKIVSEERDVKQSAYQIIVGESLTDIKSETGKTWDTGKIPSGATVNQAYEGASLQSNTTYFWRVRVWLSDEMSVWSEPASFPTGILKADEWQAQWITTQDEIVHESPLLRKEFEVEKEVEQAYVFVTASGFYNL